MKNIDFDENLINKAENQYDLKNNPSSTSMDSLGNSLKSKYKPTKKTLSESSVLRLKAISKIYHLSNNEESVHALRSITLHEDSEFYPIKRGEFVMIRGPSGGGKTTLLNIIGTLDSDFDGVLEILGTEITKNSSDGFLSELRLKHIGFVFQTFNLISTMTALENVSLPLTIDNKLSPKTIMERSRKLLISVGLEDRMDHLPSELSGGEQQRVAIARALSNKPDVLLLDEPTGDLDSGSTIDIMNLLLDMNRVGPSNEDPPTTIVMVTHNPELECYADRILYVEDGVFLKQVLNEYQVGLSVEEYVDYINANI